MKVTRAQLAEMKGCVKQSVIDAKLPCIQAADRSWWYDTEDIKTKEWLTKKKRARTIKADAPPVIISVPERKEQPRTTAHIPLAPRTTRNEILGDTDDIDPYDLDDELKREKILTSRQARAEKRKELIPRESVKGFVGQIASVHSSLLIPLGGRLSNDIALAFGITDPSAVIKVEEIITKDSYQIISMIKRKTDDYVKTMEDEK